MSISMLRPQVADQMFDPYGHGWHSGSNELYSPLLGPLSTSHNQTDPYERRAVDSFNMPENYRGKSRYLGDTIEDLVLTARENFYTTVIMPWQAVDDINVVWTTLRGNAHFMDLTPYQAPSRLMTQERAVRHARLQRHGIAFKMEHDFMRTPLGRASFLLYLAQAANALNETVNYEIVRELLHAHHFQAAWNKKHGPATENDLMSHLRRDRDRFAIAQKEKNGIMKLDAEVDRELWQHNGQADTWLIPESLKAYEHVVRPERTDYYLAGPGQQSTERNRVTMDSRNPQYMIGTSPAYVTRTFKLDTVGVQDPLSRVRQIGEYNTMIDETVDYSNYKTAHRSILIYNEDIDDWSMITLQDAIMNCGLWDKNGNLKPFPGQPQAEDFADAGQDFLLTKTYENGNVIGLRSIASISEIDKQFLPDQWLTRVVRALEARDFDGWATAPGGVGEIPPSQAEQLAREPAAAPEAEPQLLMAQVHSAIPANVVAQARVRGLVPVVALGDAVAGPGAGLSGLDNDLVQFIIGQAPRDKRPELVEAVSVADMPLEVKLNTLQTKFNELVAQKLKGFKFRSDADVGQFFVAKQREYHEARARMLNAPVEPLNSARIAGYAPPGLDLAPHGLRYLYRGSERPSCGNRVIDNDSMMRTYVDYAHDVEAQASVATPQPQQRIHAESALGFESIGQMSSLFAGSTTKADVSKEIKEKLGRIHLFATRVAVLGDNDMMKSYLRLPFNKNVLLWMAENDIPIPMNFLLFRPHMTYRTRAAIKLAANGKTGVTMITQSSTDVGSDAVTKQSTFHFTTHVASIVTEPRNVYVVPDVICEGYRGGTGAEFFTPDTYANRRPDELRQSIICVAVPIAETTFPICMDTAGRFYTEFGMGMQSKEDFTPLHYTTAYRYNKLYNWRDMARYDDPSRGSAQGQFAPENRQVWQGHQWMMNPNTNQFDRVRVNKGHWGPDVYPGVGKVRAGKYAEIRPTDYSRAVTKI